MKLLKHNLANPYLFVVYTVSIAFIIRFLVDPVLKDSSPTIIFFLPVLLSATYGGFRYGLLAMIGGILLSNFFFMDPRYQLAFKGLENIYRIVIFLSGGLLLCLLGQSRLFYKKKYMYLLKAEHKARIKAEKALKDRELFISIASHELKTPLTSMKLLIQLLQRAAPSQQQSQYMNTLSEQSNKLIKLVSQLLDISKIQTGKMPLDKELFDINKIVRNCINVLGKTENRNTITIEGNIKRNIYGDKDRIGQVITNLLSNAIKFSPPEKEIIVKLFTDKQFASVSIQDFGIGIDPKHQKKIFDRFYRVFNTKENTVSGLGIGLYISSEIIKNHGGKLSVKSKTKQGSTFTFSLPFR